MYFTITRLALFQLLAVVYAILGVGLILKIRFGSPAPDIFATHLRDYGAALFLVPIAWLVWAILSVDRPSAGAGDLSSILQSGLLLLALLVLLGVGASFSALFVHVLPTPP